MLLALLNRASTEKYHLQKLYDRVALAIRAVDPQTLIFYEPCTGGGGNSGTGFSSVPGGDKSRSVMSFHSCTCSKRLFENYADPSVLADGPNLVDGHSMEVAIEKRVKQVEHKLGGSLMVRSLRFPLCSVLCSVLTRFVLSSRNGIASTLEDSGGYRR